MTKGHFFIVILLGFFLSIATAENIQPTQTNMALGRVNFKTSNLPAAQQNFEKGLLLLHSFEYRQARTFFQRAKALDPNDSMAYWGEAMTFNHPIWNEQDLAAAQQTLAKLDAHPVIITDAQSTKANGLITAIRLLYGKGNKLYRDLAYANAMQKLYDQFHDDDEIACFYALSLLGTTEKIRDFGIYMKAAAVLEEVFARNPKHPGAAHYLIHSYDDAIHAPLGLRPARVYAKIAPAASHALHMPSHIFLALGMWDDVINSNRDAWASGQARRQICKQQNNCNQPKFIHDLGDDLHALLWLTYGYLQKRDFNAAYQTTAVAQHYVQTMPTPMTKWYYALARAAYFSESHDWQANFPAVDLHKMALSVRANDFYVNGMIMLNKVNYKKNYANINQYIQQFTKSIPKMASVKTTAQSYYTAITPSGIMIAKIVLAELKAQLQLKQNNQPAAIKTLRTATKLEDQMPLAYGPPFPIKPPNELLADVLLQQKQFANAAFHFEQSLKRAPGRTWATQGLLACTTNGG